MAINDNKTFWSDYNRYPIHSYAHSAMSIDFHGI